MLPTRVDRSPAWLNHCRKTICWLCLPFFALGRKIRYGLIHLPHLIMVQLPQMAVQELRNLKTNLSVRYLGQLSNVILAVALSVGLYNRWLYSAQIAILLVAVLGLVVFTVSCILIYYYSYETFGYCLARLWVGCLLGVVAFSEQYDHSSEDVMNILLISCLIMRCIWCIVERVIYLEMTFNLPTLICKLELLESLGMAAASFMCNKQVIAISLLLAALAITVTVIRLRSMLAILNLIVLIILSGVVYFPRVLEMPVNSAALVCFVGRMAFEPLLDFVCCRLSLLERWSSLLQSPALVRKMSILMLTIVQFTFLVVSAKLMPYHKEWFVVVPLFAVCALVWIGFHALFFASIWQLMNKISDCNLTYISLADDQRDMLQIMSSHGVRHLALIVQRLTAVTLVTTLIIGAASWTTKTGISMGLLLVVVPLESAALSLLREMGRALGGTCVGYALVAPTIQHRVETRIRVNESWSDGAPTLLATDALQEAGAKVTRLLNVIQHFFARQLVSTYGCDYSSSGITLDAVQAKLKGFFQQKTSDGPRFDSYLLYYSGEVMENGDWALAGNSTLKLDMILEWWREMNTDKASRLILILDTRQSFRWLREVQNIDKDFVALQTCQIKQSRDLELGARSFVGDFTMQWVRYNCARSEGADNATMTGWNLQDSVVKPAYSVSRNWTDFSFSLPTRDDIAKQCDNSFLRFTKPLIRVTNFSPFKRLNCFECIIKCLRRERLHWFKPLELHIGHGFKLLRV